MLKLDNFIIPEAIVLDLIVNSKKQLLQIMSEKASEISDVSEKQIFEVISQREKLGSTEIGNGVAVPHGRIPHLKNIFGIFIRLLYPIDFENEKVDLIFLILAPENSCYEHLKILSRISRISRDREFLKKIRSYNNIQDIYELFLK